MWFKDSGSSVAATVSSESCDGCSSVDDGPPKVRGDVGRVHLLRLRDLERRDFCALNFADIIRLSLSLSRSATEESSAICFTTVLGVHQRRKT